MLDWLLTLIWPARITMYDTAPYKRGDYVTITKLSGGQMYKLRKKIVWVRGHNVWLARGDS